MSSRSMGRNLIFDNFGVSDCWVHRTDWVWQIISYSGISRLRYQPSNFASWVFGTVLNFTGSIKFQLGSQI
ncbi:hypothetical protein CEXT_50221 [Caerostris extrusa]|uniref:Uncharacterized protein n=1 Tax=Caerostris extrusa TaxID=172846 RepID=A0AAV4NET2_CAEEX|nr:hypothetical protein CEXT_50221 [Caerostris extrusa]